MGMGVRNAIQNVNGEIKSALIGKDPTKQETIDLALIRLDGTPNKGRLGANATLGASLACLKSATDGELWSYISSGGKVTLPVPMMNILNGGAHADSNVDVQEFMVVPHGFTSFTKALRAGVEVYHSLKSILKNEGLLSGIGDEGGFAPNLSRNEEGLKLVHQSIINAGYSPGNQISIALDVAAQEFFNGEVYLVDGKGILRTGTGGNYTQKWLDKYPITSIEDPFGEDDWDSWIAFTNLEGNRVQIVGDDLYVTNPNRLRRGIEERASNSILIKLNQIGTVLRLWR